MKHYTNTNNPIDFPQTAAEIDAFIEGYSRQSALIHKQGNLLDLAEADEFDVIVQGCNCWNTMGGGLAREIRERYPHVADVDAHTTRGDYNKLGNWTDAAVVTPTTSFVIVNAYTQFNMSRGTDVFEYTAFDLILQKLVYAYGSKRIGLPRIGTGLANGDETVIMHMIENFAHAVADAGGTVTLVEFA